jgi:NAD(P)-dependent dehydrogenase (short-subunit alcohol dehydrogenase family)
MTVVVLSWQNAGEAVEGVWMAQRLLNKVAVVTGASGVLGRPIVQRFLAEGAKVVVFARSRGRLEELAELAPARVLIVDGDVTQTGDLDGLVQTTVRRFGGVDVLVPAAEIFRPASLQESTPELVSEVFAVNLHGALQTVRVFDRHFNPGASIVFITTSLGRTSSSGLGAFGASKAALASLGRTLAIELLSREIRVNCVAPALHFLERAESMSTASRSKEAPAGSSAYRPARIATKLLDHVAEAALFLASNEAAGVTGQDLAVDSPPA